MNKNVFLDYIDNYNVEDVQSSLENAFSMLNLNNVVKPKMKVLIKVCLADTVSSDSAINTHPSVVRAIVNIFSKMGVKCVVADSPYKKHTRTYLDQAYLNSGLLEVANLTPCELNRNLKVCEIETPNGVATKKLTLLDIINEVDLIVNVGKIKVDEELGYLGACSNIFGLVPGEKKTQILNRLLTQQDFNNYNLDILQAIKDKLAINILDGIVALEANKTPRMLYCLGVSENPYSLDAAVLDILGIKYENTILKQSEDRNLFSLEKPYKNLHKQIEDFKLQDFALTTINCNALLNKDEGSRKKYFNANQARPTIKCKTCKGCSICSKLCPTKAISMKYDGNGELYAEINYDKCIFCNKCIIGCPYDVVENKVPIGYKKLEKEINKYNEE